MFKVLCREGPWADGGLGGWLKEESRRRVKAGTTPQCFLTLAPQSKNIIVNISSELLALIQIDRPLPVQGGLAAGFKPHHTHTGTHTNTAINQHHPHLFNTLTTRKAPQQQDMWSLKSCPALITSPSFFKNKQTHVAVWCPLISANFKFSASFSSEIKFSN